MRTPFLARLLLCLFSGALFLYFFVDKQNELTELRIKLPELAKEVAQIHEENKRLHYEIDRFESPEHLMQLAKAPSYAHLKHPYVNEVAALAQGRALQTSETLARPTGKSASALALAHTLAK